MPLDARTRTPPATASVVRLRDAPAATWRAPLCASAVPPAMGRVGDLLDVGAGGTSISSARRDLRPLLRGELGQHPALDREATRSAGADGVEHLRRGLEAPLALDFQGAVDDRGDLGRDPGRELLQRAARACW